LTVQGCFLWDSLYFDEWELFDIQYNDSTHQLRMVDGNGSIYLGVVDPELRTITGTVYSGDPNNGVPEDKLDFSRADDVHANRLFYSRPPDLNGNIKYTYRQPEQMRDGWQTASIFELISDAAPFFDLMARLIRQEYDRTQLHNIHSCTKSVTSLLLGIALENHDILSRPLDSKPGRNSDTAMIAQNFLDTSLSQ
jgi:hypothetical protein